MMQKARDTPTKLRNLLELELQFIRMRKPSFALAFEMDMKFFFLPRPLPLIEPFDLILQEPFFMYYISYDTDEVEQKKIITCVIFKYAF